MKFTKDDQTALQVLGAVLLFLIVAASLVLWPFLIIWAFETLFGHAIGYGLKQWLAAAVLLFLVRRGKASKTK